jgi:hypothetical protein
VDWKQPVPPVDALIISQISSNVKRYYPLSQAIQGTEISILTGLERPVQLCPTILSIPSGKVSILTGLERPVQPEVVPHWILPVVSILTGLERPVQRLWLTAIVWGTAKFQSSPALKDRCNEGAEL